MHSAFQRHFMWPLPSSTPWDPAYHFPRPTFVIPETNITNDITKYNQVEWHQSKALRIAKRLELMRLIWMYLWIYFNDSSKCGYIKSKENWIMNSERTMRSESSNETHSFECVRLECPKSRGSRTQDSSATPSLTPIAIQRRRALND